MRIIGRLLFFSMLLLFLVSFNQLRADDTPSVIETQEDAEKIFEKAKDKLDEKFGMRFNLPIQVKMVTIEEMDRVAKNRINKNIVGLHSFRDGVHYIFMVKGKGRDPFYGTMCHEMTHAWQEENCSDQSDVLEEGLARWVEIKMLMWDGACRYAQLIHQNTRGETYGVGYRYILTLEDKFGTKGVLEEVKKLQDVPPDF